MLRWTAIGIVPILALAVNVASAHHPFSVNYDASKAGMLSGPSTNSSLIWPRSRGERITIFCIALSATQGNRRPK